MRSVGWECMMTGHSLEVEHQFSVCRTVRRTTKHENN